MEKHIDGFLKSHDHCRLSTIGNNGYPHCVPVGYFYHDGSIYIPTNSRSVKIRNLIHNSKCCVIVDTYENRKGKGVMIQGEVKIAIGDDFLALKKKLEKLSGWALNNWRVGTPPRDRVDAIISIKSKVSAIVIGSV